MEEVVEGAGYVTEPVTQVVDSACTLPNFEGCKGATFSG